jgi:hypothetical protein
MPTLHELQRKLRRFIADGNAIPCTPDLNESLGIATDRLEIFRNNSLVAHTSALAAVFPVVRQLVDPAFFAYLAHEFSRLNPPSHPCLSEFGDRFSGFLAAFPPVQKLAYLEDVARLEWALSQTTSAPRQHVMSLNQFASRSGDHSLARLHLEPGVRFVSSEFPIDLIWQMNQPESPLQAIDTEARPVHLQIRGGREQQLVRLQQSSWVFRSSIASGDVLGAAFEAALCFAPHFDLALAIAGLFAEELVVSATQASEAHVASTSSCRRIVTES